MAHGRLRRPNLAMDHAARVLEKSIPEPNSGCWLWIAARDGNGYGCLWDGRRVRPAHILSFEAFRGSVPAGTELDHTCRTLCCVNPDHLEPVSHRENVLRGAGLTAKYAKRTHCKNGHEFTEMATRPGRMGRRCRACESLYARNYIRRKKAAAQLECTA